MSGACQFHLPTGPAQVLRGITGLVLPDLDGAARGGCDAVAPRLAGTRFAWRGGGRCGRGHLPLGQPHLRLHAPAERFGRITLGMPYVELDAPPGSAEADRALLPRGAARARRAPARMRAAASPASPPARRRRCCSARPTREQPDYDGNHIQIALADFSGPYRRLLARGLVTEESNQHQCASRTWSIPPAATVLVTVEHEVRSMRHPMYARALVNRNAAQTNNRYAPGHEAWPPAMAAEDGPQAGRAFM